MNKKEIRQLICSMTIGDGHITKRERDGALIIEHGSNQEDYMHWKADLLDSFFIKKENPKRCRRRTTRQRCRGKYYDGFRMELYWKDYIGKFLRERTYKFDSKKNRYRKNIEYLLSQLESDLHVAIFFMDDGGEMYGEYRGKIHKPWYGLYTCEFDIGQQNLTKEWFKSKYNCNPDITYLKSGNYLRFNKEEAEFLFSKFRPYFEQVPSIRHKFRYSFLTSTSKGEGSEAKQEASKMDEDMVQRL